jgi:hypothetical protein
MFKIDEIKLPAELSVAGRGKTHLATVIFRVLEPRAASDLHICEYLCHFSCRLGMEPGGRAWKPTPTPFSENNTNTAFRDKRPSTGGRGMLRPVPGIVFLGH